MPVLVQLILHLCGDSAADQGQRRSQAELGCTCHSFITVATQPRTRSTKASLLTHKRGEFSALNKKLASTLYQENKYYSLSPWSICYSIFCFASLLFAFLVWIALIYCYLPTLTRYLVLPVFLSFPQPTYTYRRACTYTRAHTHPFPLTF